MRACSRACFLPVAFLAIRVPRQGDGARSCYLALPAVQRPRWCTSGPARDRAGPRPRFPLTTGFPNRIRVVRVSYNGNRGGDFVPIKPVLQALLLADNVY